MQWDRLDDEVEGIAAAIAFDIQNERFQAGEIPVLVNRQEFGERLRLRLAQLQVPAHSFFSQECLNTREAREGLALLRGLAGDDPVSLRVLLGLGDNNGRSDAYQKLSRFAASANKTERQILEEVSRGTKLPFRIPALVERFESATARLNSLPKDNLPELVDALFPADQPNTAEIREIALGCIRPHEPVSKLRDRIVERITQHDVPESPDFVRIMSLHKSKGLTSRSVIVMGALDGVIPTLFGAKTESEIQAMTEEQRRLMYVAVTRASEHLIISYFREIEFALASSLGIRTAKGSTRHQNGSLWARALATPYLRGLGPSAPEPLRGVEWIESYTSLPPFET
ncbi:MAG: 3'-5' exonuclease [Thermomicrobiales bacterium]